jgi:hypothetical protein
MARLEALKALELASCHDLRRQQRLGLDQASGFIDMAVRIAERALQLAAPPGRASGNLTSPRSSSAAILRRIW